MAPRVLDFSTNLMGDVLIIYLPTYLLTYLLT